MKELKKYLDQIEKEPDNIKAHKDIKDYYEKLGEIEKAKEVEDTLNRLIEKKGFESNVGKSIFLKQVELHNLDFFGDLKWTFQPQVNVLLGRNGYGKSLLLRLLAALLQKDDEKVAEFFQYSKKDPFAKLEVEKQEEHKLIHRNKIVFEESIGKVPILAIPDLRMVDKSKTSIAAADDEKGDLNEYGAYHFLHQKSYEGLIHNFLYQLCITYLDKGKTFDLPIFQLIHKVVGKLSDHQFVFHKIEPFGQARFKIEAITEGNKNPLPIQKASQGTLSILAILGLIYQYLRSVFPKVPGKELLEQPAIVFIDELDAHLHPSWQQKIAGVLRDNFPNVQFVVTAHSPLVVAGCKEGEAAVLKKGKKGFVVKQFEQDFIGYQAGELYEKVFEIEEKDETYLYYTALYPFKGEIEEKIKQLEEKKKNRSLSKEQEKTLEKLYDDLYYLKRANERYKKRREYSGVLRENRKLKAQIKQLQKENGKQDHGAK